LELTGPSPHNVDGQPPFGNYKSKALFHRLRRPRSALRASAQPHPQREAEAAALVAEQAVPGG